MAGYASKNAGDGVAVTPAISAEEALQWLQCQRASNLLHDIRSPLQVARGYTRLLLEQRGTALTDVEQRYLSAILASIANIGTLAEEIRDIPKNDELRLTLFDFGDLLRSGAERAGAAVLKKGITLAMEIRGALPIIGDRDKLCDAVNDLLSVSVEFTWSGETLTVVAAEDMDKIGVRLRPSRAERSEVDRQEKRITTALRMWRLHGGTMCFPEDDGELLGIDCDLPAFK